ncbi:Uu.00g068530.m01.CDS01 [Anthostomella pinea]|uniref:Uu.00g068530.m01.CDS01 n=1 Tax=Anthostomella pinea TaxID=933095 RepID=A0AAI8VUC6_9PEZI|nr:Uu.00g068530.m01.CDS01 [Anthostomella pinea]
MAPQDTPVSGTVGPEWLEEFDLEAQVPVIPVIPAWRPWRRGVTIRQVLGRVIWAEGSSWPTKGPALGGVLGDIPPRW